MSGKVGGIVTSIAMPLSVQIPQEIEDFLWDTNPWWQGRRMRPLPPFRRWLFESTLQRLKAGLAPVTVLRGPRQVGKTTLQEQIIDHLLHHEDVNPKRIFRIQFDEIPSLKDLRDPILSVCRWFERHILDESFNERAHRGEPAFLFFDEVQNLTEWAPQIKALVDHHAVRVILTGSSALRIEHGWDSLAGRISTLELGTLLLREIASLHGWGELPPLLPPNGLKHLQQRDFWETLRTHGLQHREVRSRNGVWSQRWTLSSRLESIASRWKSSIVSRLTDTAAPSGCGHFLRKRFIMLHLAC